MAELDISFLEHPICQFDGIQQGNALQNIQRVTSFEVYNSTEIINSKIH